MSLPVLASPQKQPENHHQIPDSPLVNHLPMFVSSSLFLTKAEKIFRYIFSLIS